MLETLINRFEAVLLNCPNSSPVTFIGPPSSFSATTVGDLILETFAQGPYSAALAFLMSQSPTQPLVSTVEKLRMKIINWHARWIADLRRDEARCTHESLGARLDAPFDVERLPELVL
jgi:hypothetical protein